MNWIDFFTDPVLRAPTIGSMLMCLSGGLVGVLVFVRKFSLLGEALSHAAYPGSACAILCGGIFSFSDISFLVLAGAFFSAQMGYWLISLLKKRLNVSADASLCLVLSLFFGIGITITSYAQSAYTHLYRQIQTYLYGQAATMTDVHILIYGGLSLLIVILIFTFYKDILVLSFDRSYAKTSAPKSAYIEILVFILISLAIVIGIRCVGVVLMSAMLVAPAVTARQFTNRFSRMFPLAGLFGAVSGFFGTYFSVIFSGKVSFPTGPMIVLVASAIALYALLFAPERGLVIRYVRIIQFRNMRIQENLLKGLWRMGKGEQVGVALSHIAEQQGFSKIYLKFLLWKLTFLGWVRKGKGGLYFLTLEGMKKGGQIVRLHRLWEVYLVNSLGLKVERVHKSAEEMEHILTPELEKKLTELLDNPQHDPHDQPIPSPEVR